MSSHAPLAQESKALAEARLDASDCGLAKNILANLYSISSRMGYYPIIK
jgi:hypothetical protein